MERDPNEQEIEDKINALCDRTYGDHSLTHLEQLFRSYDESGKNALDRDEIERLLRDAEIGNWITRGYWVDGVFEKLDRSPKNGVITWEEYLAVSTVSKADVVKAKAATPATEPVPVTEPSPSKSNNNDAWGMSTYSTYEDCDPDTGICLTAPERPAAVYAVGAAAFLGLVLSRTLG